MSIRKISRKLFISTAAFFWASCGGDSEYPPVASNPPNDLTSSTSSFPTSSSEIEESSSSSTPSSSSEAVLSSSKESSSSIANTEPIGPYRLARDTSVSCKVTSWSPKEYYEYAKYNPSILMDELEKNYFKNLTELEEIEDHLEFSTIGPIPSYGSYFHTNVTTPESFACSDGTLFKYDSFRYKDSLIFSNEEYIEKYPQSVASPLCRKTDFLRADLTHELDKDKRFIGHLNDIYKSDTKTVIDSVIEANKETLSATQTDCINAIKIYPSELYEGPIATKQICDGDTIVNPRYQEKREENKESTLDEIKNCLDKTE